MEYAYQSATGQSNVFVQTRFTLLFVPHDYWVRYYAAMNATLPINVTGSNPTLLLQSKPVVFRPYDPHPVVVAAAVASRASTLALAPLAPASPASGAAAADADAAPRWPASGVDWRAFLQRHDLVWRWRAHDSTWPSVYQLAAWTGNGLFGVTAMVDSGGHALRFDVARTDVYNCGTMPRMSIGSVRLGFAGVVVSGTMRQVLHRGVLNGTLATSLGAVSFVAYAPAGHRAITVEWTVSGRERVVAWFQPFVQAASSGQGTRWSWPPFHCANNTATEEAVCTQPLACGSYSTAIKTAAVPATRRWRATVGIGNQQTTYQYPPDARRCNDSAAEAVGAAREAMAVPAAALLEEHEAWWARHWAASALVSVPDTRAEAFYAIQAFKLGAAYRADGVPIIDQQGPFKADCAGQFNGTAQDDGHCSGWRGLWFDYNVEMNYYMPAKANRPDLVGSLSKSFTQPEALKVLLRNGLTMASASANASWEGAMDVSCGMGLNMAAYRSEGAVPSHGWSSCHPTAVDPQGKPWPPGECISTNILHVAYLVHRECLYSAEPSPCIAAMLPLLFGGIRVMQLHSTVDSTGAIHTMPTHMSDYPGLAENFTFGSSGPDSSETLEEYRWACTAVLDAAATPDLAAKVPAPVKTLCAGVVARLTKAHVDMTDANGAEGALMVYGEVPLTIAHRSPGFTYGFYPFGTLVPDAQGGGVRYLRYLRYLRPCIIGSKVARV